MELYEHIFESASDALLVIDREGCIRRLNCQTERLFLYRRDELIGQPVAILIPQRFALCHATYLSAYLANPMPRPMGIGFELYGRRKDDTEFPVEISLTPLQTERGLFISTAVRDTSERKRSEAALRASEERYRNFLRLSAEGVSRWEHDTPIPTSLPEEKQLALIFERAWLAECNEAYARMYGFENANEMLGMRLSSLFPDTTPEDIEIARRYVRDGYRVTDAESNEVDRTGREIILLNNLMGIHREGLLYGGWCVQRDITERKRAERERERTEKALQESEARYRAIVESSLDGLIVVNAANRIVEFNAAAETMFGYPREDAHRMNLTELILPLSASETEGQNTETFPAMQGKSPGSSRAVRRAQRANGSEFRAEVTFVPINGIEPPLFAVGVRDITERLRLEEQLRQSQKMQAIGQLAGGVAHDFNNLLTAIIGYSDLLLLDMPDATDPRYATIHSIRAAGERAARLTRQLLLFSRKAVLEPRPLDLNQVIQSTDKILRRLIGEDIILTTRAATGLHRVEADASQIEQVILNLCLNARDAMPQGGNLTIETRNAYFDEDGCRSHQECSPGHFVQLLVSDTGCGIRPEVKSHLFEPFFTTKEPGKGTGLGLATVYGIVEQSGGFLTVYSEVGSGTTFTVNLPATGVTAAPLPSESNIPSPPGGRETILLAEDEEEVRRIARVCLERHGYRVLEALNGQDALRLVEETSGSVDLLITDVVMPEISGRQLAERLRARYGSLKVLFMSGYNDDAVVRHGILEGKDAFLQKPFTLHALGKKVRDVLDAPDA